MNGCTSALVHTQGHRQLPHLPLPFFQLCLRRSLCHEPASALAGHAAGHAAGRAAEHYASWYASAAAATTTTTTTKFCCGFASGYTATARATTYDDGTPPNAREYASAVPAAAGYGAPSHARGRPTTRHAWCTPAAAGYGAPSHARGRPTTRHAWYTPAAAGYGAPSHARGCDSNTAHAQYARVWKVFNASEYTTAAATGAAAATLGNPTTAATTCCTGAFAARYAACHGSASAHEQTAAICIHANTTWAIWVKSSTTATWYTATPADNAQRLPTAAAARHADDAATWFHAAARHADGTATWFSAAARGSTWFSTATRRSATRATATRY